MASKRWWNLEFISEFRGGKENFLKEREKIASLACLWMEGRTYKKWREVRVMVGPFLKWEERFPSGERSIQTWLAWLQMEGRKIGQSLAVGSDCHFLSSFSQVLNLTSVSILGTVLLSFKGRLVSSHPGISMLDSLFPFVSVINDGLSLSATSGLQWPSVQGFFFCLPITPGGLPLFFR